MILALNEVPTVDKGVQNYLCLQSLNPSISIINGTRFK